MPKVRPKEKTLKAMARKVLKMHHGLSVDKLSPEWLLNWFTLATNIGKGLRLLGNVAQEGKNIFPLHGIESCIPESLRIRPAERKFLQLLEELLNINSDYWFRVKY